MSELVITLPDGRMLRHALGDTSEVIGRDIECDIPIDDPSASRQHARFTPTPQGYLVEDMGSKNGTLVNDVPSISKLLEPGDRVQVGSSVAEFRGDNTTSVGTVVIADEPTSSHATRYIGRDQRLLLSQQRLEMIYALNERLTTLQSQDQLLETAMGICCETLRFERGAIGVRRPNSRVLDWPVVRNLRGAEGELTISRSLLTRALQHGERAIFTDDGAGTSDPTVSMVQHGILSAMCVPLIKQDEILGVIYGDRVSTSTSYASEDIDFFAGIAQQVSIGLVNCRLLDDHQQMIRMSRELELARSIQTGLFPTTLPKRENFEVAAINEPGDRISGDYYDVIERDDGCIWCVVADVTGEGVAAALLMANLQAAVRITLANVNDPSKLLTHWNELVWRNTDSSKFITCLLALIDPNQSTIRFASAGHCEPILLRDSEVGWEVLEVEQGFPLGVVQDAEFPTTMVELGGEPVVLFCYTDGVIEAMNPDLKMLQMDGLIQSLTELGPLAPAHLIKQVRKCVTEFAAGAKQSDDITMLAARIG